MPFRFSNNWKTEHSQLTIYKYSKSARIKIDYKQTIHSYYPDQGEKID